VGELYQEPEYLPWDGRRVPITFVGGYLGAGKTTAINEVLAHTDRPIAVIVNDVGSINIDAALVQRRHGDTIELTDGCVCCSSIEGMGAAFNQIRARPIPPDHVIVELSGVAEPQQMLPWGKSVGFMLDGLVVVVAANQLATDALPTWIRQHLHAQIAAADLLILTKTDLVSAAEADDARARLAELAPGTPVFPGGRDLVDPGAIGRFLALGGRRPGGPTVVPNSTLFDAHDVRLVAPPDGLTCAELDAWLRGLASRIEGQLVRAKGIVATTDGGLILVQIVGGRQELTTVPEPEHQPPTDLVVICLRSI
jgi:G3E family GTPase